MRSKVNFCGVICALVFAACASPKTRQGHFSDHILVRPLLPVTVAPVIPPNANIMLVSSEQLSFFDENAASYLKVYVDHRYAGRTDIAAKSAEKKWGAALEPGRHLFRFEKWDIAPSGNWHMLSPQYQPPEQWLNLSSSSQTLIDIVFFDHGLKRTTAIKETALPH